MRAAIRVFWLTVMLLCARTAGAFNPPMDRHSGLSLSIGGVPEKVETDKPLTFTVTLKNEGAAAVCGNLRVWMNEDWDLNAETPPSLTLAAGQVWQSTCTAAARDRVVAAHYPIHARFDAGPNGAPLTLHPIAVFTAVLPQPTTPAAPAQHIQAVAGIHPLTRFTPHAQAWERNGSCHALPYGFNGSESESGATLHREDIERGGVRRRSISLHPPWKGGHGTLWSDYRIALPADTPLRLTFHMALRDTRPDERASDGVTFKVLLLADGQPARELFSRHCSATVWQPAEVDLSAFAGQAVILRLWNGPGAKNDTTCDTAFWGDPLLRVGAACPPVSEAAWAARVANALQLARAAASGERASAGAFRLGSGTETYGAAIVTGNEGLTDGVIAFSDGRRDVAFRGFTVELDGQPVGGASGGQPVEHVEAADASGTLTVRHVFAQPTPCGQAQPLTARARASADRGVLRITWDLPGAARVARGEPRFTRLALGPATRKPSRIYLGAGAVFEGPGAFTLPYGGVQLGTRHIGADYDGGLSLVQASDLLPDRLVCQPEQNLFSLETPHDAGFLFAPSARGAYAAARAYRAVSGFAKSPGVDALLGRVCLDQWSGDYRAAAAELGRAAQYGLTHSVFVKHDWQRWGYDYRLPEIYPPSGGLEPFLEMRRAAREAGMLFAPHDNYIDFYPDAKGFSYDRIVFHADGTPHTAWFHPDRRAQSYRWLPDAFTPWLAENMQLMRQGFQPDALFIDVFTSVAPFDYYDRAGAFHTRAETVRGWRAAFDTSRTLLGRGAAMLSESGHDALIGSIDGAQADHWRPDCWLATYRDADRTPWHDMVTHGKMVLFAGGLGQRYDPDPLHGYGSDDYLSNTVLGGRGPMCDGPFSRRAVMTYWLLHDVCDALARAELEAHTFGPTVRQQHTSFSNGGKAWANRGTNTWSVADGQALPPYGFYVKTPAAEAGVVRISGHRAAFAKSEGLLFADARPPADPEPDCRVETQVLASERLGPRSFRVAFSWNVLAPLDPGYVPFVHIGRAPENTDERIEAQAGMAFDRALLTRPGRFSATADITLPLDFAPGDYFVRYGLYHSARHDRVPLRGREEDRRRICGGLLRVTAAGDDYLTKEPAADDPDINVAGALLDFGPVATEGAFRLAHAGNEWRLTPLPASRPLRAELRLAALGKPRATVKAVERLAPFHADAKEPEWRQEGDVLRLSCDARSFAYRITLQ